MGLFSPKFSEWKTIPLVSSQQNHFKHVLEFDWLPATKNPIRLENNAKYLKNLYSGGPVSSSVSTTSIYYNLYIYYKHIRVFVLCGQFSFSKTNNEGNWLWGSILRDTLLHTRSRYIVQVGLVSTKQSQVFVNLVKIFCQYIQHCNRPQNVVPYIPYILPTIWRLIKRKYWTNAEQLFKSIFTHAKKANGMTALIRHPYTHLDRTLFHFHSVP